MSQLKLGHCHRWPPPGIEYSPDILRPFVCKADAFRFIGDGDDMLDFQQFRFFRDVQHELNRAVVRPGLHYLGGSYP